MAGYHEKNLKEEERKRKTPKQTTVKLTMCIFLGDGKTEKFEEELRLRELMDFRMEKGFLLYRRLKKASPGLLTFK